MNKADLYAVADLIIQKLNCIDDSYSEIEKGLLKPYVKQLILLQNAGLIQTYANEIFGGIVQTIVCKVVNELSKKEPDLDGLMKTIKPVYDFMKTKIGYNEEELDDRANMSDQNIEHDLETLEKEIANWVKEMPHVAMSDEVSDELRDEFKKIKEQVMNMKKETFKWKN